MSHLESSGAWARLTAQLSPAALERVHANVAAAPPLSPEQVAKLRILWAPLREMVNARSRERHTPAA